MLCKHSSNRGGGFVESLLHPTKEQIGGGYDPTRPLVELSKPWYFIQGSGPELVRCAGLACGTVQGGLLDHAGFAVRRCRMVRASGRNHRGIEALNIKRCSKQTTTTPAFGGGVFVAFSLED